MYNIVIQYFIDYTSFKVITKSWLYFLIFFKKNLNVNGQENSVPPGCSGTIKWSNDRQNELHIYSVRITAFIFSFFIHKGELSSVAEGGLEIP